MRAALNLTDQSVALWELKNQARWDELVKACDRFLANETLLPRDRSAMQCHLALGLFMQSLVADDPKALRERAREVASAALVTREALGPVATDFPAFTAKKVIESLRAPDPKVLISTSHRLSNPVRAYVEICQTSGADAALVSEGDACIGEYRSSQAHFPATAMSTTKSVVGIAAFLLAQEGKLKLDAPVHLYLDDSLRRAPLELPIEMERFPETLPQTPWDIGPRSAVTIRNLLTHTSGIAGTNYFTRNPQAAQFGCHQDPDMNAACMPLTNAPAQRDSPRSAQFDYSNPAVQLLAPILSRAAGMPLVEYVKNRIFSPIGMNESQLSRTLSGGTTAFADMWTTPRDLHRLGLQLLALHTGDEGRSLLTSTFAKELFTPVNELYPGVSMRGCAHLIWRGLWGGVYTSGYLNNDVYVLPASGLVVVRMQAWPPPSTHYLQNHERLLATLNRTKF